MAHNKVLTQKIETLTAQIAKLPLQIQVVQLSQSHSYLIRCDFCGGDHPNGHYFYQNNLSEVKVNYMSNQGKQGGFSNNNNYSQGWRSNQNQNFGWN